jgi:PAS domain S-box-containing protein
MKSTHLIPVTLLLLLNFLVSASYAVDLRVAVYENPPMIFADERGEARGFYVDVLRSIASAEGYKITYVRGKRAECMAWLRAGRIDLMPGIALEPAGTEYDLTHVALLSDWGRIYTRAGEGADAVGDLTGKTIAVARDDCMYVDFKSVAEGLGLGCHYVEVDGYYDALRMVGEGVVDACLVPRLYAGRGITPELRPVAFVGRPMDMRFGVRSGADRGVAAALDYRLEEMRNDRSSAYYRAVNRWFGNMSVPQKPGWRNLAYAVAITFLITAAVLITIGRVGKRGRHVAPDGESGLTARQDDSLSESERRLRTVYDKMNEGVCLHEMIFDESGHAVDYVVLDVNPSYESILGLGRADIIGKRGSALFDIEEPPFIGAYADVAATGHHSTFDSYFAPARRHFRVSAFSPMPGTVAAIFSDVTDSKEQMDELKTSEGKYRILFENAPDPMYLNDLSGIIVDSNRSAQEVLGYARRDLVGESVIKPGMIPVEQTLRAANNISLCAQGKPTGPDEFTLIRKDGTHVETEISMRPVKVDGQTLCLATARVIAGRIDMQKAIRESEERLQAVCESMGDGVIVPDLNGNIQQVNRSALRLLGYASKEDMLGTHAYLCVAESDRQRASEDMMRALKTNERIVGDYELVGKAGHAVPCQVSIDLLKSKDGDAIGFVLHARDIAARKARECAMEEDIGKYRSLLEGLDEAVFRVSLPVGKYDYVSPSVKRVFGYTSVEFMRNPLLMRKLIHPDHMRYFNEMWKDLIQGHIQPSYEYKIVDRDGEERWVLQTNRRVFDEDGKVIAIEGVWRDITEQRQSDDTIRENEAQFRSLFEGAPTALEFYDSDRRLVHANSTCLELLGVDDVRALRKLNLLSPEHAPDEARAALESRKAARWESVLDFDALRESGGLETRRTGAAHLEILVSPVDVRMGSSHSYLVEIRNVSEDKMVENEMQRFYRLDSATRLARAVAQDFNGVLARIMDYSESLSAESVGDETLANRAEEIRKVAGSAAERIRQLLAFSRAASLKSEDVDLNSLISESRSRIARALGEDKTLEVKPDAAAGEIRADREHLENVLIALARNAGQAMHSGQTLVIATGIETITEAPRESVEGRRPGRFACIKITDEGMGMEGDVLERAFEPFFTTREGAPGMGLSVVYGTVRQHGGWIEVHSEPGKGTEFSIYLPAKAPKPEEPRDEPPAGFSDAGPLDGGGQKILLVEEDEIVRAMAARVLRERGYSVTVAAAAAEARKAFEKEGGDFALVLCDMALPDASGLDLADNLRAAKSDLKVLMTSGYADRQSQIARLGERDFPVLEKPYALFDLLSAVKDLLGAPLGVRS